MKIVSNFMGIEFKKSRGYGNNLCFIIGILGGQSDGNINNILLQLPLQGTDPASQGQAAAHLSAECSTVFC